MSCSWVTCSSLSGSNRRPRTSSTCAGAACASAAKPSPVSSAGIAPVAAVQNLYNLTDRTHEEVVDLTAEHGIAFVPFFPIAVGDHAKDGGPVATVAAEIGATPAQTALAWLLHRSPTMLPIPGTTSVAHLEENVAAAGLRLTGEQFARLGQAA
ncbi:aldo/keto reductase [Nonomuraea sp. NPDC050153]|uniref:aldo/keto reductase n=1 Tax=Nonomuraea sp. NPDC050153 TaxID=3364359 RepID=UPI003791EE8B